MNRNTKLILTLLGGIALLCLCGCIFSLVLYQFARPYVEPVLAKEPAEVAELAAEITAYDLPSGYREEFGAKMLGFSIIGIDPEEPSSGSFVTLMIQFPRFSGLQPGVIERRIQESFQDPETSFDTEAVEQITRTIRDQEVTLTIRDGTDDNGKPARIATGVFKGKGGAVLLVIISSPEAWNQAEVDAFIESFR